jgi:hypothetical protein
VKRFHEFADRPARGSHRKANRECENQGFWRILSRWFGFGSGLVRGGVPLSVSGTANFVLSPRVGTILPFSFFTGNSPTRIGGSRIARNLFRAVRAGGPNQRVVCRRKCGLRSIVKWAAKAVLDEFLAPNVAVDFQKEAQATPAEASVACSRIRALKTPLTSRVFRECLSVFRRWLAQRRC